MMMSLLEKKPDTDIEAVKLRRIDISENSIKF